MTTPLTRRAASEDAEQAILVLRESITKLCVADHRNDRNTLELWLANKTPEHFARWLANADAHIVVAEIGFQICGAGALSRAGTITLCYVHPNTQRLGIGRHLLGALEAQARSWGLRTLALDSSLTARGFYERHGYVPSGDPHPGFGITICYPYSKEIVP